MSEYDVYKESVIEGEKYRFTILSPRLIRLEYSENGLFENNLTMLISNRKTMPVDFTKKEDNKYLEITTSYFRLTYEKNKPFYSGKINTMKFLKVELLNTDKIWYYGHPEVRNYGALGSLTEKNSKLNLKKGLYSIDGFCSINDKSNIILEDKKIVERDKKNIDIYLFMYLKDFALCLKDYFLITGSPSLIPRYALGNWWCKNERYNDILLKELVDDFREKEIPLSIILLDKKWHNNEYKEKNYNSGFTFNHTLFSNPKRMIDYLHRQGIRLGLNVSPFEGIMPYEPCYDDLAKVIKNKDDILIFNVFDQNVINNYFNYLIKPLDNMGVDFYWIDATKNYETENAILNYYHMNYSLEDYKRRPMIISKNVTEVPHKYSVLYSGKTIVNWETLKMIPYYNSSASNIGVSFWTHDIGGYHKGTEDNELYTRYVQLGVFSPILKFGAEEGKYYKREPWKWSIKTYNIVKEYLQLRHRLIPYIYAESYKYYKFGMPLIMPLYYKFPEMYDDLNLRNSYFFGTEFFISPIVNKKDYIMNRSVHKFFLPDGVWYDFVTGKKFPGGKKYISFFKDEDYPVFAKAGSIITLGDSEFLNDTTPPKNMEIQIFPGRSNTYQLYEDDGISELYKKNYYLLTEIDYNYMPNNYTVILRPIDGKKGIIPDTRNYKFVFRNTKRANDVSVHLNDLEVDYNSYVDNNDFIVEVENISTVGQLTVNCKGKDIEIDAVRIINDDVESIISDLQIETRLKEELDKILFSDLSIKRKRIEIRKLSNKGLESKFIKLFLKILEYINEI